MLAAHPKARAQQAVTALVGWGQLLKIDLPSREKYLIRPQVQDSPASISRSSEVIRTDFRHQSVCCSHLVYVDRMAIILALQRQTGSFLCKGVCYTARRSPCPATSSPSSRHLCSSSKRRVPSHTRHDPPWFAALSMPRLHVVAAGVAALAAVYFVLFGRFRRLFGLCLPQKSVALGLVRSTNSQRKHCICVVCGRGLGHWATGTRKLPAVSWPLGARTPGGAAGVARSVQLPVRKFVLLLLFRARGKLLASIGRK